MTASAKIKSIEPFQVSWTPGDPPGRRTAFVRVTTTDGVVGYGEASPMQGGLHSLGIIERDIAPVLIGADAFDQAVIHDKMFHRNIKLGPEGALTGALAAIDIALWDIKGKVLGLPVYKLLGGAWRTEVPFYASIGGNAGRTVDETVRVVEARFLKEKPAAIKIRWDGDRTKQDEDSRRRHRQGEGRPQAGGRRLPARVRREQSLLGRRGDPRRASAGGAGLPLVRGAGAAL